MNFENQLRQIQQNNLSVLNTKMQAYRTKLRKQKHLMKGGIMSFEAEMQADKEGDFKLATDLKRIFIDQKKNINEAANAKIKLLDPGKLGAQGYGEKMAEI